MVLPLFLKSEKNGCSLTMILLVIVEAENIVNANSADPDQRLHSAASDLDLHCLPVTFWQSPD